VINYQSASPVTNTHLKSEYLTFPELYKRFKTPNHLPVSRPPKLLANRKEFNKKYKNLEYFTNSIYSNTRAEKNYQYTAYLFLDLDDHESASKILLPNSNLTKSKVSFLAHETLYSCPEHRKAHLIFPLGLNSITKHQYAALEQHIEAKLNLHKDPDAKGIYRLFFTPNRFKNEEYLIQFKNGRNLLDTLNLAKVFDSDTDQKLLPSDNDDWVIKPPLSLTSEQIKSILDHIPKSMDRNQWFHAGAALNHQFCGTAEGLELFCAYSEKWDNFDSIEDCTNCYNSLKRETGNIVTFASLIKEAKIHGYIHTQTVEPELVEKLKNKAKLFNTSEQLFTFCEDLSKYKLDAARRDAILFCVRKCVRALGESCPSIDSLRRLVSSAATASFSLSPSAEILRKNLIFDFVRFELGRRIFEADS